MHDLGLGKGAMQPTIFSKLVSYGGPTPCFLASAAEIDLGFKVGAGVRVCHRFFERYRAGFVQAE